MKWFINAIIILFTLFVIVYLAISIYGGSIFFQTENRPQSFTTSPATYGLNYEEVSFVSASIEKPLTLRGWWIPNPNSQRAIIIVHGKDSSRLGLLEYSHILWEMGFNLLYFDSA